MGMACLASTALISFLESCSQVFYVPHTTTGNRIIIKKADMMHGKYLLVRDQRLEAPVFLHAADADAYSAVLLLCTHKDCELNPAANLLICPCHGSEFSMEGKVLQGPADSDLKKYTVSTDAEHIYIQL